MENSNTTTKPTIVPGLNWMAKAIAESAGARRSCSRSGGRW